MAVSSSGLRIPNLKGRANGYSILSMGGLPTEGRGQADEIPRFRLGARTPNFVAGDSPNARQAFHDCCTFCRSPAPRRPDQRSARHTEPAVYTFGRASDGSYNFRIHTRPANPEGSRRLDFYRPKGICLQHLSFAVGLPRIAHRRDRRSGLYRRCRSRLHGVAIAVSLDPTVSARPLMAVRSGTATAAPCAHAI
jgi:hypothetical protein